MNYGFNNFNGFNGFNGNGYGFPQQNQYMPTQYQQQNQNNINTNKLYANGIEDVRNRQLPPNSDFLFLDNDKPLIYRKYVDSTGKMTTQAFEIKPYEPTTQNNNQMYVTKEEFEAFKADFKAEIQKGITTNKDNGNMSVKSQISGSSDIVR